MIMYSAHCFRSIIEDILFMILLVVITVWRLGNCLFLTSWISYNYKDGIRNPGGRAEDSRSKGSGFDSWHWAKISNLRWSFDIGFHTSHRWPSINLELWPCDRNVRPCNPKAQFVRVGPFPMISGVIVKSGVKFRLDPAYKPLSLSL